MSPVGDPLFKFTVDTQGCWQNGNVVDLRRFYGECLFGAEKYSVSGLHCYGIDDKGPTCSQEIFGNHNFSDPGILHVDRIRTVSAERHQFAMPLKTDDTGAHFQINFVAMVFIVVGIRIAITICARLK